MVLKFQKIKYNIQLNITIQKVKNNTLEIFKDLGLKIKSSMITTSTYNYFSMTKKIFTQTIIIGCT